MDQKRGTLRTSGGLARGIDGDGSVDRYRKRSKAMTSSPRKLIRAISLGVAVMALPGVASAVPMFAVWLDGNTTPGGGSNGILASLDNHFGVGSYTLVTTAQLATAGFLNSYKAVIVSRFDAGFGTSLSPQPRRMSRPMWEAARDKAPLPCSPMMRRTISRADLMFLIRTSTDCLPTRLPSRLAAATAISVSSTAQSWR